MKYCVKCGAELQDTDTFCPKCGQKVGEEAEQAQEEPVQEVVTEKREQGRDKNLLTVALVFNIIACVIVGWALIPLAWMIPMTVSLNRRIQNNEPISVGFKVCDLLFVSLISGIILLVADEND